VAIKTTDEFRIPISVENETDADFKKMEVTVAKTLGTLKNYQRAKAQLDKTSQSLSASLEVTNQQVQTISASYMHASKTSGKFTEAITKQTSAVQQLSSTFATIGNVVSQTTQFFSNLINIIDVLTDPEKLRRFSQLLSILSIIMRLKGQKEFSQRLRGMSKNLDSFADRMEVIRERGTDFQQLADRAEIAQTALDVMEGTVKGLAVTFVGLGLSTLIRGFDRTRDSVFQTAKVFTGFGGTVAKTGFLMANKFRPSLLKATEAGLLLSPVLLGLGALMKNTDNQFIRFAGTLASIAAIILGSFATAMLFALRIVGDLFIAIGDKLVGAMASFQKKSIIMEESIRSLTFTIQGFSRELGVGAVGSVELWTEEIEKLNDTTKATRKELTKSAKLMISEGIAIGLTLEQNIKLFQAVSDIAADTGKKHDDVTQRIISALAGQSQSVLALGINTRETALEHSKFVQELETTTDALSEEGKVLARLSIIFDRANKVTGAAVAEAQSIAGATEIYDKRLVQLQERLGKQGELTRILISLQTRLVNVFLKFPEPIISIVGNLQDFLGVSLKIVGVVIKYAVIISTLTTVYLLLNAALVKNGIIQGFVQRAFVITAAAINTSTGAATTNVIATNSMSAALLNLSNIIRGSLVVALTKLRSALTITAVFGTLTAVIGKVTIAVGLMSKAVIAFLLHPVVLAVTAITVTFLAAKEAIAGVVEETEFLNKAFAENIEHTKKATKEIDIFGKLWELAVKAGHKFWKLMVDIIKFAILGYIGATVKAVIAIKQLRIAWNEFTGDDDEAEGLREQVVMLEQAFNDLRLTANLTKLDIGGAFSLEMRLAAKNMRRKIDEAKDSVIKFDTSLRTLAELGRAAFDPKKLRLEIFADEFKRAEIAMSELSLAHAKVTDQFAKDRSNEELREQFIKTKRDAARAFIELGKLRIDTVNNWADQERRLVIDRLKNEEKFVEAIRMENTARLKAIDEQVRNFQRIFGRRSKEVEQVQRLRKELEKVNAEELKRAKEKAGQTPLEAAGEAFLAAFGQIDSLQKIMTSDEPGEKIWDAFKKGSTLAKEAIKAGWDAASSAVVMIASGVAKGIRAGVDFLENLFGGKYINEITKVFSFIGDVPTMLLKAFSNLDVALEKFIDTFPRAVERIFKKLPSILENILRAIPIVIEQFVRSFPKLTEALLAAIPQLVDILSKNLPKLVSSIASQLPAIADALLEKMPEFIEAISFAMVALIERVPEFLEVILQRLPAIITMLLEEALPRVGRAIMEIIPAVFEIIMRELVPITRVLTEGLVAAAGDLAVAFIDVFLVRGGLERIVMALIKYLPVIAWQLVVGIIEGLKKAIKAVGEAFFSGVSMKGFSDKFSEVVDEGVSAVGESIARSTSELFQVQELALRARGATIGDDIRNAILSSIEIAGIKVAGWWEAFRMLWQKFINNLKAAWNWVAEKIINPIWDLITKPWIWIWDNILSVIPKLIRKAWEPVAALLDLFKIEIPVPEWLSKFENIVDALLDWDWPSFAMGGLATGAQKRIAAAGSEISDRWKRSDAGKAVSSVGSAAESVGISTPRFAEGGLAYEMGEIVKGITYAQRGSKAIGTDTIPAMLTPGEFIVNREATRANLGLLSFINQSKGAVTPVQASTNISVVINAKTDLSAAQIRREVVPALEKHLRRKSQEGGFVLAAAGVRA